MSKDILSPPIVVIGKRRYRVNVIREDYGGPHQTLFKKEYQEEDLFGDDDEDAYEIEELADSIFRSSFHVPRAFYGRLIGQKAMTKKRLESETQTELTIPWARASADSFVSVKGKSRKDVCAARRRIDLMIESMRIKMPPTHFACVPACTEDMKKAFNQFKQAVLSEEFPGIDELLFIRTEKIHITFAACTLLDDEERVKAAQIFMDCKDFVATKGPIDVAVRGLDTMNDDPSSCAVLYARIESPDLQELADKFLQKFKEAHLNNKERQDSCKLHMTIMNARYRKQLDAASSKSFDVRRLLQKYGDFDFGKFRVTEIHLSQMHTAGENGFYVATGIISV